MTSQSSHYDLYVVRQHGVYCVNLSGEDLSRYSNKTKSVWFKKMSVLSLSYQESDVTITKNVPHIMAGKQLSWILYESDVSSDESSTSLSPYNVWFYAAFH